MIEEHGTIDGNCAVEEKISTIQTSHKTPNRKSEYPPPPHYPFFIAINIMNTPSYEVVYFGIPGRAENIRILLHAAGIDFTDTHVKFDDWKTLKPTTPLGTLPILKVDGVEHVQSLALMRYAAKLAGFYPTDDHLAALRIDEVMDTCAELASKAPKSADKDEMKKLRQEYQATTMTQFASFLEGLVTKNKEATGSSLMVGTSVTLADMMVNGLTKSVAKGAYDYIDTDFFVKDYPGIMAAAKAVDENEKVLAYYASKK
jgi:prostaglandin-H2 D-isomerase / glutathione transferase